MLRAQSARKIEPPQLREAAPGARGGVSSARPL